MQLGSAVRAAPSSQIVSTALPTQQSCTVRKIVPGRTGISVSVPPPTTVRVMIAVIDRTDRLRQCFVRRHKDEEHQHEDHGGGDELSYSGTYTPNGKSSTSTSPTQASKRQQQQLQESQPDELKRRCLSEHHSPRQQQQQVQAHQQQPATAVQIELQLHQALKELAALKQQVAEQQQAQAAKKKPACMMQ
jgi:hypothetical protein